MPRQAYRLPPASRCPRFGRWSKPSDTAGASFFSSRGEERAPTREGRHRTATSAAGDMSKRAYPSAFPLPPLSRHARATVVFLRSCVFGCVPRRLRHRLVLLRTIPFPHPLHVDVIRIRNHINAGDWLVRGLRRRRKTRGAQTASGFVSRGRQSVKLAMYMRMRRQETQSSTFVFFSVSFKGKGTAVQRRVETAKGRMANKGHGPVRRYFLKRPFMFTRRRKSSRLMRPSPSKSAVLTSSASSSSFSSPNPTRAMMRDSTSSST